MPAEGYASVFAPSPERIDETQGYTPRNLRFVCRVFQTGANNSKSGGQCMISKQCNGLNVLCRMQSTLPGDRRMAVQVLQVLYKGLQCFLDCHRKRLREWFAMLVSGVQSDQACLRKIGATPTKLGNA
jgi:hypothetical protein